MMSMLLPAAAGWTNLSVALYIAWYAYRSMRVVYVQSRPLALSKLAVLVLLCGQRLAHAGHNQHL